MFAEFRSRYPTGCLVSKMLEFTQGQYVVTVAVEQEGQVLATGMAAADTLEEAEDRARVRALEAFGLVEIDYDGSVTLLGDSPPNALPSNNRPIAQLSGTASTQPLLAETVPSIEAAESTPETTPEKPETKEYSSTKPKVKSPAGKSSQPSPIKKPISDVQATEIPELDFEPIASPVSSSPSASATPASATPAPSAPELPADLSDAIAQIDLLMGQVGWDKKQGVAYLQEAYGKRTRAELTDQELMGFLGHLQTLVQKDLDF
ncbi:MAG: hypothetical protein ACFCA4_13950 [Cyanophyceae cyanobacterium]